MEDFLDEDFGQGLLNTQWHNFYAVPNSLDDAGLDVYEHRIWCHLQRRSGSNRKAWPSIRTMAEDLGISTPIVIRSLRSLQEKKLLAIVKRQKQDGSLSSNLYVCVAPEQEGVFNDIEQGVQQHLTGVFNDIERKNIHIEEHKDKKAPIPRGQIFMPEVAKQPPGMPNPAVIRSEVLRQGLTEEDADKLINHWQANGFRHGNNKVQNWTAVIRNWKIEKWFPSQKKGVSDRTAKTDWSKY